MPASVGFVLLAALALALFPMRRPPVRDDPPGLAPAVEHHDDVAVQDDEQADT